MRRWAVPTSLALSAVAIAGLVITFLAPDRSPPIRTVANASPAPRSDPPPHAVLEGDPVFRFGIKPQKAAFTRSWTIRNDGKGPLIVEPEPAGCSCVEVELPRLSPEAEGHRLIIPPGGRSSIELTWKTRDFDGPYRWPLTLLTNDPNSERRRITFLAEGVVRPPVAIDPKDGLSLGEIYPDEAEHRGTVTIYSPDRADLKIKGIVGSRPGLLDCSPRQLSPDEAHAIGAAAGYRLEVVLKRGMPPGSFREIVEVQTDHPGGRTLTFPVTGRMMRPIAILPERLRMLAVRSSAGGETSARIVVRKHRRTEFRLVQAPSPVSVEIIPEDRPAPSGTYRLRARIAPGTATGSFRGVIVLKTDHPDEPELTLPIEGFIVGDG